MDIFSVNCIYAFILPFHGYILLLLSCWNFFFQLGNPLGRGTKRRREVEDDIKVISLILGFPLINDAWSMEDIRQAFVIYQSIQPFSINLCFEHRQEVWRTLTNCCPHQRRRSSPPPVSTSTGISFRSGSTFSPIRLKHFSRLAGTLM